MAAKIIDSDVINVQRQISIKPAPSDLKIVRRHVVRMSPDVTRSVKRKIVPSSFATDENDDDFDMIGEEEERPSLGKRIVAIVRKAKTRKVKYLVRTPPPSHYIAANVTHISESESPTKRVFLSKRVIPPSKCLQQRIDQQQDRVNYRKAIAREGQTDTCCCEKWWVYCLMAAILTALAIAAIVTPIVVTGTGTTSTVATSSTASTTLETVTCPPTEIATDPPGTTIIQLGEDPS